jgi:hypothetical protein
MANIIIKGRTKLGRTRSEQEKNLRKDWGPTMSEGQLERTEYLERKAKKEWNSDDNFISQIDADRVK